MGENGAGKSTLIKIISGAYAADPGSEIRIDGAPVVIDSPAAAIAHGIAVIYQELSLSPNLTVAENVYLGREIRRGLLVDRRSANERCRHILDSLGADFSPTDTVSALSLAERQLVEIARAIHANVRILVMDEPTAALSLVESERLFALIQRLRGRGLAIVYVSHRMAEIARLADRVTVLRDGAVAGAIARADITHERVVRMMVGRDLAGFYQRESRRVPDAHDRPFFEVRDIGDSRRVHGCSFALRRGEILGIAGLPIDGRVITSPSATPESRGFLPTGDASISLCGFANSSPTGSAPTLLLSGTSIRSFECSISDQPSLSGSCAQFTIWSRPGQSARIFH